MKWLVYLSIIILICFSSLQTFYTNTFLPYRLVHPLTAQTHNLPGKGHLKVDEPTAKFFGSLKNILKEYGFEEGDPVIGIYDMPGIIWAIEAYPPGAWWNHDPVFGRAYCEKLKQRGKMVKDPFVLLNENVNIRDANCISYTGYKFPMDFIKVGEVWNPYPTGGLISIYVWEKRAERFSH